MSHQAEKGETYVSPGETPCKGVTMHRCIAILGPAIRVSYRDPSIAILKKKKKKKKKKIKVTHGF